jgi:hypothetical protein
MQWSDILISEKWASEGTHTGRSYTMGISEFELHFPPCKKKKKKDGYIP